MGTDKKRKTAHAGLSISRDFIELAIISPKSMTILEAASVPTPEGLLDTDGDRVLDPLLLKDAIQHLFRMVKVKPKAVHLSVPASLLRMVEMPRLDESELYVSLSSEAERYKTFDDTEALVDFYQIEGARTSAPNMVSLVFGAVRKDTLECYLKTMQKLKIKVASVDLEALNVLRGMAVTGVLDSLVQQIGTDAHWGAIFVESTRVRLAIWQGNGIVELRETHMPTAEFSHVTSDSIVLEDLMEEIRRTTKNVQPLIWLTHHMPEPMCRLLGERLGVPVRPCLLGNTMGASVDLSIPIVGAAFSSMVAYPMPFDILSGARKPSSGKPGAAPAVELDEDDNTSSLLIGAGVLSIVGSLLLGAGLFMTNEFWFKQEVQKAEQAQQAEQLQLAQLQSELSVLKDRDAVDKALIGIIENAEIRNKVYVMLTEDLRRKTPPKLWVQEIKVNGKVKFEGKAVSHQDILDFAKSFDTVPYVRAVAVDSITEELLEGTPVFNYKIAGNLALSKDLLNPPNMEQVDPKHNKNTQ